MYEITLPYGSLMHGNCDSQHSHRSLQQLLLSCSCRNRMTFARTNAQGRDCVVESNGTPNSTTATPESIAAASLSIAAPAKNTSPKTNSPTTSSPRATYRAARAVSPPMYSRVFSVPPAKRASPRAISLKANSQKPRTRAARTVSLTRRGRFSVGLPIATIPATRRHSFSTAPVTRRNRSRILLGNATSPPVRSRPHQPRLVSRPHDQRWTWTHQSSSCLILWTRLVWKVTAKTMTTITVPCTAAVLTVPWSAAKSDPPRRKRSHFPPLRYPSAAIPQLSLTNSILQRRRKRRQP